MLRWLVIGGGIHGTHLSHALLHGANEPQDRVRVLDPHAAPMRAWTKIARNLHMRYLRSLGTEHVDLDPASLLGYARSWRRRSEPGRFLGGRPCPSLNLFLDHSEWVIRRYRLDRIRIRGRALGLAPHAGFVRVATDQGVLEARNVIIAIGRNELVHRPAWVDASSGQDPRVLYALDPAIDLEPHLARAACRRVAIVGGGMTAAHLAECFCRAHARVTVIARRGITTTNFDFDPVWAVAARTRRRVPDPQAAREAQHHGTMTPELAAILEHACRRGTLSWITASVERVAANRRGCVEVAFSDGRTGLFDLVVLATGYDRAATLPKWVADAAAESGLACDDEGVPLLDDALRWHSRIRVTGDAAGAILGPLSANIVGARLAAERILASID